MSLVSNYNLALLIGGLAARLPELPGLTVYTKRTEGIFKGHSPSLYLIIKRGDDTLLRADASDEDICYLDGSVEEHMLFGDFKNAFYRDGGLDEASELLNRIIKDIT